MEEKNWKYIVYETTNLVNNKIYIGLHKTIDPDIFDGYIGNGIYVTQPYTYEHARTAFQYAVKKYGPKNFRRKTLAIFDTLEEASDLEEKLVDENFLARSDVYNMVLGGLGGYFISNRLKVYQYDTQGNFIKEYESYAEAGMKLNCSYTSISLAVRKKVKIKNSFWSTDRVEKLDISNYNLGLNHAIIIYVYNLKGKYLGGYKSITSASKKLNSCVSTIHDRCIFGGLLKNKCYVSYIKEDTYDKARKTYIATRPVYRYNSDGSFSKEYETQLDAEQENNTNITKAIRLKTPDEKGYMWGLEKLESYNKPKEKCKKRIVGKYDLDGNLVKIYESATAAENAEGTAVWHALRDPWRTHKKHQFKYLS